MRKLTSRTAPSAAYARPPTSRPAGHRSGEGSSSVLPGLREDAAHRPEKAPEPAEHPTAGQGEAAAASQAPRVPRRAADSGLSRRRLARPAWTS
jgi:hypothetical protein